MDEKLLCLIINYFGTGEHAWAEPVNLKYFVKGYVLECIEKASNATPLDNQKLRNKVFELKQEVINKWIP